MTPALNYSDISSYHYLDTRRNKDEKLSEDSIELIIASQKSSFDLSMKKELEVIVENLQDNRITVATEEDAKTVK